MEIKLRGRKITFEKTAPAKPEPSREPESESDVRPARPAAMQVWVDGAGSPKPLTDREWISQKSCSSWSTTRGLADVEW